jgi:chromosome segregation ATPase
MVNNGNEPLEGMELTVDRDESFNSITGLNGSGKSNILDSICFVLGITNMTTVRAQNLQVCAALPSRR